MKLGRLAGASFTLSCTVLVTMILPTVDAVAGAPARCNGFRASIVGTARADVIRGTPQDDVIVGLGGADVINGRGGDDTICGGRGSDRLIGGSGNFDVVLGEGGNDEVLGSGGFDVLSGGPGGDLVDGGLGSADVATFFRASESVTVDLVAGTASGEGSDTLQGIEQVEGSEFDDQLTGDAGPNTFYAQDGDDVVVGGGGLDRIAYVFAQGGVVVDLTAGTAVGEGSDTLSGIQLVEGSRFDDAITGDAAPNTLNGGDGDDVIVGGDGDDSLGGGDGNDSLDGGNGNDALDGGPGTDTCTNGENVGNCEA